jgi:hypothetical protein
MQLSLFSNQQTQRYLQTQLSADAAGRILLWDMFAAATAPIAELQACFQYQD